MQFMTLGSILNDVKIGLSVDDVNLVPQLGLVSSRSEVVIDRPFIYSAPMDTVTGWKMAEAMVEHNQSPVISRFLSREEVYMCLDIFKDHPDVWFSIGIKEDDWILQSMLDHGGTFNVALDVAHGDMTVAHERVAVLSELPFINKIMSGSICTPDAADRAVDAGCTHLRVGVGPGAACTTRMKTGIGVPQLTAVYLIGSRYSNTKIEVIADGGIRKPGDMVKYLAAGADSVMMGSAFSRCDESAGWRTVEVDGSIDFSQPISFPMQRQTARVKSYRGQASAAFQKDTYGKAHKAPEGASSGLFKWEGLRLEDVLGDYVGSLQSACSYLGITHIDDIGPWLCQWVRVTTSGFTEGTPHGV